MSDWAIMGWDVMQVCQRVPFVHLGGEIKRESEVSCQRIQHKCPKDWLTTASQSGGWVPETSRSFHIWQPAPRCRPLPWLANPGNPGMSPHAEGEKTGSRHTDKTVERKGGTGEGRQPPRGPLVQEKR